jgi:hypothetical protein
MDLGSIFTGAIFGALLCLIGSFIGLLLNEIFQFKNKTKVLVICYVIGVSLTPLLIRSDVGKAMRSFVAPKSLMERAAYAAGLYDVLGRSDAKQKFAEWRVSSEVGAQMLTAKGLKRLDFSDLYEWNQLRLKMAESDSVLCSSLWNGRIDKNRLLRNLENLGETHLTRFLELSATAGERELGNYPYLKVTDSQSEKAIKSVLDLYPEFSQRFVENLQAGLDLNDDEACWTFKYFANAAQQVGKHDSETIIRLMVGE